MPNLLAPSFGVRPSTPQATNGVPRLSLQTATQLTKPKASDASTLLHFPQSGNTKLNPLQPGLAAEHRRTSTQLAGEQGTEPAQLT
jgi:hypothetical protein